MNIDPSIFLDKARNADPVLAAASNSDVRNALIAYLDGLVTVPYVDPETLEFVGYAVGRTGHTGIDVAIENWVAADPSEHRVKVGAWFLYGYWGFTPVESRGICLLVLNALGRLPRLAHAGALSEIYVGALLALYSAYRTSSLTEEDQARIKSALLFELPFLHRFLRRTGQNLGFVEWIEALG